MRERCMQFMMATYHDFYLQRSKLDVELTQCTKQVY